MGAVGGLTHATILSEEAAYLNYAFETTIATALSCAYPLHRYAMPSLRERHLPGIVEGREIGAICVTEPNVGSDSAGMSFPRNYRFMGRRGCVVGEVRFENCRVPEDHLLGGSGLGVARSAFDIAQAHAQTRVAFGQKLGCKQLVWNEIAEMSWRLDAVELPTYRAAKLYDAGVDGKGLMKQAAMAKLVATETANLCAAGRCRSWAATGSPRNMAAPSSSIGTRALTIVGGTSEMAKYLIASRDLPELKPNL
jgi:alkylation response protein AidB-like acyl-CoA dehydrogenase